MPTQPANNKMRVRAGMLEVEKPEEEGQSPKVRMSVSSETPVLSYIEWNGNYQRAWEILDHSDGSVDMSRCKDGLVILDKHYGDQIGLMQVELSNKKLGGIVEFCTGERAQEIGTDAAKGLRRNVSIGYAVDSSSYVLEGEQDGIPVVRAKSWLVYEASFEPVPADINVGVNRAAQTITKTAETPKEKSKMEQKEISAMYKRAAENGIAVDKVSELIEGGKGMAELDAVIVDKLRAENVELKTRKPEMPTQAGTVDPIGGKDASLDKEIRKYSVSAVVRAMAGDRVDIGREREISDELAHQRGKSASGIIIPHAAFCKRALTVTGTSSATVQTDVLANEFIDLLRSNSILGPLGVRILTGLRGNVAIPKMSDGATGYWVAEANAITGSQPTLGQVAGTPHTCGMLVDISRLLLNQSAVAADMIVTDDIISGLARTVQTAVFAGTGADGQPSAITTATGIANPAINTAGTPTFAELLAFPASIIKYEAQGSTMRWAMTSEVWAKLAATATNGNGSPLALNPETNRLCGYEVVNPCDDLPANSLWFGDWSTVNVGVWGNGVDITVDSSTLAASGGLRIVGLQDVDVMVRLGKKLAYNTTVTA